MPHRKNLTTLSSDERRQLADLMGRFLNDAIIAEHVQVFNGDQFHNPNHETFFPNHRTYLGKLETFLFDNGGRQFVPLPFWNDDDDIPSSFLRVQPWDNGTPRPDLNAHWAQTPRHHRLPDSVKPPHLCDHTEFDNIVEFVHTFEQWHQEVHALLGPVMALGAVPDSPAAFIFWAWHGFNDELYHRWERCRLLPVRSLATSRNADGRWEAFALGKDGRPWHCWKEPAGTYAEWSLWNRLGDPGELMELAAGANQDGRLEVFAVAADHTLRHTWQLSPNGAWSDWENLNGNIKRIVLGSNPDGSLEIVALGTNDQPRHIRQTAPNSGWSGWESLPDVAVHIKEIAIGNHKGRLEVFALGNDGRLFSSRQASAGSGPWSMWEDVSGDKRFTGMAAGKHGDGHLQLFAITTDNKVIYKWRRPTGGQWSGEWRELEGLKGNVEQVAIARNADSALEVFVIAGNSRLFRNRELLPGASISWSGWDDFVPTTSGGFAIGVERFAVGQRSDGGLEIFAGIRNDVIWHTSQVPTAFLEWERWRLL